MSAIRIQTDNEKICPRTRTLALNGVITLRIPRNGDGPDVVLETECWWWAKRRCDLCSAAEELTED
jgi:hypothetical protein